MFASVISYLAVAFVLVIFGTRNGRALLRQHSLSMVRTGAAKIPYTIRLTVFRMCFNLPLPITKRILDIVTLPQGNEKTYIQQKDISPRTTAHWIGSGVTNLPLGEVESTAADQDLIVMLMHGGGFTVGNSTMYMPTMTTMLNGMKQRHNLNARILSVDYPLALTHPYPHAPDACFEAYQYLVYTLSVSPSRIVIMGDSAGGNMVATLLLRLCEQRRDPSLPPLPQPAGGVMVSPWVTLHDDSPTYTANRKYDISTGQQLNNHVSYYLPDDLHRKEMLDNPLVSPLFGSFTDVVCPLLVTYSDHELFQYDIMRFVERARQDHVKVDTICRPYQPHIWIMEPMLSSTLDVWREDLAKVTDWIVGCI